LKELWLCLLTFGKALSSFGALQQTFGIAGFVEGMGVSNNGSFTSSNAKDFGTSPAQAGTVNATYSASAATISGTVSAPGGSVTFSGGPIAGSLYNYNTPASLATVAGAWTLTDLSGIGLTLNVGAGGAFTASSAQGCNFSGTIAPRASGKNVFNVTTTFGPAPYGLAGQTATGIAVAYRLASGATQLIVTAVDSTRTHGSVAFGTR